VDGTIDAGPSPEGGFLLKVTAKTPVKPPRVEFDESRLSELAPAAKPWLATQ
jgi:hypothetical protein